jgi:hypothetical protein
MRLIWLVILAVSLTLAPLAAEAQQTGKVYRIGFLRAGQPPTAWVEAFQQGLRERGYVAGQNIAIEFRFTDGSLDQLPRLADEAGALEGRCQTARRDKKMNYPGAIIIASGLIAGALLLTGQGQPQTVLTGQGQAQTAIARYALAHDAAAGAAWRMDTTSGSIWRCVYAPTTDQVKCTQPVFVAP